MLKKSTTVIICAMLVVLAAGSADAARKGRLIGKIVDPEGNPLEGVTVKATSEEVPDFNEIEVTDSKGVFKLDFEEIEVVYRYEFSKVGYVTLITEQTWRKDGTARYEWVLTPGESASLDADAPVVTNSAAAQAYAAAVQAFEARDLPAAEAKLEEALEHDPELRQAWESLAVIELEQGDYAEAVVAAETAIEKGSTDMAIFRSRWEAYRLMGDEEMMNQAAADLEKFGALAEEAKRIYNEGIVELKAGNKDAAFAKFEQALQADPNLEPALFAVATTGMETGRLEEAAAAAQTILEQDPGNADALRIRYNAALQLDDEQMLMDALVGLAPVEPEAAKQGLWLMAMTAYNANDNERSKERFERVLLVDPGNAQAHYLLGLVYLGEDNKEKTTEHLERFIALAPDDPDVAAAKDILAYINAS
ncbi:MAG: tetratricopeptide repeat protein [Thermoanaerobaculales bacterium]|jgi:Tfp pilus assembly protein PilF|nr:tetratricopeptide repeat protein [Thermoanaerobaculales bacterium]